MNLDDLLDAIDQLEDDTEPEVDPFPWCDAARWSPTVACTPDPYGNLPAFMDDGAVIVVDAARPWIVTVYEPPWWAAE